MASAKGYSATQIILHWLNAVIVVFLLMPVSREGLLLPESNGPLGVTMTMHIWAGIAVLPLVTVRLVLRFSCGVPAPETLEPALLCGAGRFAHLAMYFCMLTLPISGACHWYLGIQAGHVVHEVARILLTSLIGLHISAALTHHFILRNHALLRVLRPER